MSQNILSSSRPKTKGTVIGVVFIVLGFGLLFALSGILKQTLGTYLWEKVPCTILVSEKVEPGPERTHDDGFVIRYRYNFVGQEYTSDKYSIGLKSSIGSNKLDVLLSHYQPGTTADCYVNKSDPAQAVLRRGTPAVLALLLFPLIFLGLGFGALTIARRKVNSVSNWGKEASWFSKHGFAVLFFGLFTVIGGIAFYFLTYQPMRTYFDARSWTETPCEIVSSSVGRHTSSGKNKSTTYSIDIVYRYTVAERSYLSDRYELLAGSSSGRDRKQIVVDKYPVGSKSICYVNPRNPTDALLNRNLRPFMMLGLIPLLFLILGLSGFAGMLRKALKSDDSGTLSRAPELSSHSGFQGMMHSGRTMLKTNGSPMTKFVVSLIGCLFWNAIVSLFAKEAFDSWSQKNPDHFLTLFITPFVLIGLGLIGLVGRTFLNLFNPRVSVSIQPPQVMLGGPIEVHWVLTGAVSRLRRLSVVLEGHNETTRGSGKNRSTKREVFASLPISETTESHQFRQGSAQIVIPKNLQPTSETGSTKVVWELKVRGEIPLYPDMSDDFAITVRS